MFYYTAYGLRIQSELLLPELSPAEAGTDVTIHFGAIRSNYSQGYTNSKWPVYNRDEAILQIKNLGIFAIRGGCEVIVAPAPGADDDLLRLCLSGLVMGALLTQRGRLVLHASSVKIDGDATAFLGEAGWGKSTIAAALITRGHSLIADDVTSVDLSAPELPVTPGFPRLKVDPEVATTLGVDIASLLPLSANEKKRWMCVAQADSFVPITLKRVYVLEMGTATSIAPLSAAKAVMDLMRHSYPISFPRNKDAANFLRCAHLARIVRVCRLERGQSLPALSALAEMVERDFRESQPELAYE